MGKLQLAIFLGQIVGPSTGGVVSDILGYRTTFWMRSGYLLLAQVFVGLSVEGMLSIVSAYIGCCAPEGKAGAAYGLDTMATSLSNAVGRTVGGWLGATSLDLPFYVGCVVTAASGFAVFKLPFGACFGSPAPIPGAVSESPGASLWREDAGRAELTTSVKFLYFKMERVTEPSVQLR